MNMLTNEERAELLRLLVECFNLTELKSLAFVLSGNYEQFQRDTLPDFARELFLFCERRGLASCLLNEFRKQRPDKGDWLATLLAKMPPCYEGQKIQVIVAETLLERVQDLLESLARELDVPVTAITVIGAAWGSMRLLLGVPNTAINFTRFKKIAALGNGNYHIISIEAYTFLSLEAQKSWQLIATTYPPVLVDKTLYATIGWQAAYALVNKKKEVTAVSPPMTSSSHWLNRANNQTQMLLISRELINKLSPGETDLLENLFPNYTHLAQRGQVRSAQQAQREFGLAGDVASLAVVVLSVLFTAVNAWMTQQNRQSLAELKIRQETEREILYRLLDDALRQNHISRREQERLRPLLAETIAQEIGDPFSAYEMGLEKLIERAGQNLDLLTYEQQLRENISQARRYGDMPERASRRSQIIEQLNLFSLRQLGKSFNRLCSAAVTESDPDQIEGEL
ncbi:MAG: hypothetical protein IPJ94_22930 [Chloroflexi bacterium]|nr:hypothetical protein [Chloroflexota bacterium]